MQYGGGAEWVHLTLLESPWFKIECDGPTDFDLELLSLYAILKVFLDDKYEEFSSDGMVNIVFVAKFKVGFISKISFYTSWIILIQTVRINWLIINYVCKITVIKSCTGI